MQAEHQVLSFNHPCLPEPIAMIILENDAAEDMKLFNKIPEWEHLKKTEPVLIEEYFTAKPLEALSEKLESFTFQRRFSLIYRIIKFCEYIHSKGYSLQNINPRQILMKPRNGDNVYFIGLHNARKIANNLKIVESHEKLLYRNHFYFQKTDIAHLGFLFYYLLTLNYPFEKIVNIDSFLLDDLGKDVEKSIRALGSSELWLKDLLYELIQEDSNFRIPDLESVLSYFNHPPDKKIRFDIINATPEQIELKCRKIPKNTNNFKVRVENIKTGKIFADEFPVSTYLKIPGQGFGKMVCSLAGLSKENHLTWWTHKVTNISLQDIKIQVTPLSVTFFLDFTAWKDKESKKANIILKRKDTEIYEEISSLKMQPKLTVIDNQVIIGKTYQYFLFIDNLDFCLLDKNITIPTIDIVCNPKHIGYETVVWEIYIGKETSYCLDGKIEIVRGSGEEKEYNYFYWDEEKDVYYFEEKNLYPGNTYHYTLNANFKGMSSPYSKTMGTITTKIFILEENIEVEHNRACITWSPSPAGKLENIEIYDNEDNCIAKTVSDCITLENLEPEQDYCFPLKYRYSKNLVIEGKALVFKTLAYKIESRATDVGIDCFRLRWNIEDIRIAKKIEEFVLKISNIIGQHKLGATTRSVFLKQLYPSTDYKWQLYSKFKTGNLVPISDGETKTKYPEFSCEIEVGLVHHIVWSYPGCPAIDKIEVYRNDTRIMKTSEKEMYDSDFKGEKEISYKFYYILKDNRRIFALEKKIKPLSMSNLFSALKVEPDIGTIKWNFDEIKQFKFFKYIELIKDSKSLYKKGAHIENLEFEDCGDINPKTNEYLGLENEPMNYQLAVVGVAPNTVRKYKKKWTLNIRGISCNYIDLPKYFTVIPEYSCIYFEWEECESGLLKEIIIKRLDDNSIIYQGKNESCMVLDDDDGNGLKQNEVYNYEVEMIYPNHKAVREFEVELNDFDITRLDIKTRVLGNVLEITWDNELETSITNIGWRRSRSQWRLTGLFQKPVWTEFEAGMIAIPLPNVHKDFYYQLTFHDRYNASFAAQPEQISPTEYTNTLK